MAPQLTTEIQKTFYAIFDEQEANHKLSSQETSSIFEPYSHPLGGVTGSPLLMEPPPASGGLSTLKEASSS